MSRAKASTAAPKLFCGRDKPPNPDKWNVFKDPMVDPDARRMFDDPQWHLRAQGGTLQPNRHETDRPGEDNKGGVGIEMGTRRRGRRVLEGSADQVVRGSSNLDGKRKRVDPSENMRGEEVCIISFSQRGQTVVDQQELNRGRYPLSISPVPSETPHPPTQNKRCAALPVLRTAPPKVPNRRDHFKRKKPAPVCHNNA